ncbi:MAG: RagB/SusD family nutrient uptake outer membrane protein [Bacteroidales bacterium]|nr:RagB/SusD family nutrient uptake outer membrane protein [Bacteroidales bacterium]
MKKTIYFIFLLVPLLLSYSCDNGVLERPPLTTIVDDNFWRNETDIRLYANGFYENFFIGYNTGTSLNYVPCPLMDLSDNITEDGIQVNFEDIVPTSRASASGGAGASYLRQYEGPTWNFHWIRRANIFIERLENLAKPNLSDEAFKHWMAVAKFFRGLEYSRLVSVFGDVPYFDRVVEDNDFDYMYKDRDDRGVVMDQVYEDFKYVLDNIRVNDGKQMLNRYITAAFISRHMLFEGTFLHYHSIDEMRSKKYLTFAQEAAEIVMNSGQYKFSSDYKSIFASESLDNNEEVLLWRTYDETLEVMHSILARQNGSQGQRRGANLDFIKSYLCVDGKPWQNSTIANASSFSIKDLVISRDSRFEATIMDIPNRASVSSFYIYKNAPRDIYNYVGSDKPSPPIKYTLAFNTTDAPIIRLAEVVLNWIEAKAVLAEAHGGSPVTQDDLNKSINAIRNRPLASEAIEKGVKKTAPLQLSSLPNDPERDADVSPLMWEIRRERRVEFFLEYPKRIHDLRRWKKMEYMNFDRKPDYFLGPWVNISSELPELLTKGNVNVLSVQKQDGTTITYNGSNASQMVGFFVIQSATNRQPFGDEVYMAPIGERQITEYQELGYTLTQTINW